MVGKGNRNRVDENQIKGCKLELLRVALLIVQFGILSFVIAVLLL